MANRREVPGRWIAGSIPIVEYYRGAGGFVCEGFDRHTAVRRTVVCSPSKQRRVCPNQIDISLFTVGNSKLMYHRVGLKIDPYRTFHMLVAQDRPPEQVDDGVGAGVQLFDL